MFHLIHNRITPISALHFIACLMLATTEVNGCDACSYAHTQMALKSGSSKEKIDALLRGDKAFVAQEEAKAILFAEHYAFSMGQPDRATYEVLINEYGLKKAKIILSAVRMIMLGNIMGIPLSALISRLQG